MESTSESPSWVSDSRVARPALMAARLSSVLPPCFRTCRSASARRRHAGPHPDRRARQGVRPTAETCRASRPGRQQRAGPGLPDYSATPTGRRGGCGRRRVRPSVRAPGCRSKADRAAERRSPGENRTLSDARNSLIIPAWSVPAMSTGVGDGRADGRSRAMYWVVSHRRGGRAVGHCLIPISVHIMLYLAYFGW